MENNDLIENSRTRFAGASWAHKPTSCVVIGAGGIGSWAALGLTRAGHKVIIYDADIYEAHNLSNQFCSIKNLGLNKAEAIKEEILNYVPDKNLFKSIPKNFDANNGYFQNVTILAVDDIEVRKSIFEQWLEEVDPETDSLLIDGRMTAESFVIYAVVRASTMNIERYKETLFPKSEANVLPCGFKGTSHTGMGIGYIITSLVNNFVANEFLRDVPFKTNFNNALMTFEVEF
jgi:hypothetical protein